MTRIIGVFAALLFAVSNAGLYDDLMPIDNDSTALQPVHDTLSQACRRSDLGLVTRIVKRASREPSGPHGVEGRVYDDMNAIRDLGALNPLFQSAFQQKRIAQLTAISDERRYRTPHLARSERNAELEYDHNQKIAAIDKVLFRDWHSTIVNLVAIADTVFRYTGPNTAADLVERCITTGPHDPTARDRSSLYRAIEFGATDLVVLYLKTLARAQRGLPRAAWNSLEFLANDHHHHDIVRILKLYRSGDVHYADAPPCTDVDVAAYSTGDITAIAELLDKPQPVRFVCGGGGLYRDWDNVLQVLGLERDPAVPPSILVLIAQMLFERIGNPLIAAELVESCGVPDPTFSNSLYRAIDDSALSLVVLYLRTMGGANRSFRPAIWDALESCAAAPGVDSEVLRTIQFYRTDPIGPLITFD